VSKQKMLNYFIINTPSVRLRRTATPFKKGELKAKTPSCHCEER